MAQEPFTTKEWKEISCDGIDQINCNAIWGSQENSNCWIYNNQNVTIYKFIPNKENATLEGFFQSEGMPIESKPFILKDCLLW